MDEDRIAGTARKLGGKIQEEAGRFTGDTQTQIKGNGKSGGWYRSRLIRTGRRRRPRYCRNVRQVAPQHHRNTAICNRYSCSRYWVAAGTDASAALTAFRSCLREPARLLSQAELYSCPLVCLVIEEEALG
jgi:hypothetical protein